MSAGYVIKRDNCFFALNRNGEKVGPCRKTHKDAHDDLTNATNNNSNRRDGNNNSNAADAGGIFTDVPAVPLIGR